MVKDIQIDRFDYNLPDNFIAKYPLEKRDDCKLLLRTPKNQLFHRVFKELPDLLPPGSLLVCNDTKVIKARLLFHKQSGAAIEIFLLEPLCPSDYILNFQSTGSCAWKCLVGNLKKWKEGEIVMEVPDKQLESSIKLYARRLRSLSEGGEAIEFHWNNPEINFSYLIEKAGEIPIPPYLNRESNESDITDYQTIYAQSQGSVAAPTAGLHFTPTVFEGLATHAIPVKKLTLHVGAGTFRPVKSNTIGDHDMHSEKFSVSADLVENLLQWKKNGKPIVATGTTTVRTLESLPYIGYALKENSENPFHVDQWTPYSLVSDFDTTEALTHLLEWMNTKGLSDISASTSIMIAPEFHWRITDIMVTNFHQPKSTLLLLVSSFLGKNGDFNAWRTLYDEALKEKYRFLSYGDACLLFR